MTKISIAIPTYEYKGHGVECLEFSFKKMENQVLTNFDVIISDHSVDNEIENLCKKWSDKLDIKYYRNEVDRGNPASNTNNAMNKATGEWIKILCQDDYLVDEYALTLLASYAGKNDTNWIASGYWHTYDRINLQRYHSPQINGMLCITNTIGTPSCTMFRNINPMLQMDTNLKYAYDCEFYWRYIKYFGQPYLLEAGTIVNYLWDNSISSAISDDVIVAESTYILKKHGFRTE